LQVKKADIQRVAQKYLTESNRTVGWFIPTEEKARKKTAGAKKAKGGKR
jgi:hypothetical protein